MSTHSDFINCVNCGEESDRVLEKKGDFQHYSYECENCGFYAFTVYDFSKKTNHKQNHQRLDLLFLSNLKDIIKEGGM